MSPPKKSAENVATNASIGEDASKGQKNNKQIAENEKENEKSTESTVVMVTEDDVRPAEKPCNRAAKPLNKGLSPPCLVETSSLDARNEFKRHMEEIMEATKVTGLHSSCIPLP